MGVLDKLKKGVKKAGSAAKERAKEEYEWQKELREVKAKERRKQAKEFQRWQVRQAFKAKKESYKKPRSTGVGGIPDFETALLGSSSKSKKKKKKGKDIWDWL